MKKIFTALLSLVIFTTMLPLPLLNDHESSAYAPSCSIVARKMENTTQFLENLLNDYERSMGYANDPFHSEYRDRHLELAYGFLEMSFGRFDSMMIYFDQLMICEGDVEAQMESIEQTLTKFITLAHHSAILDEHHDQSSLFFVRYAESLTALLGFRDHPTYDKLYKKFLGDPSDELRFTTVFILNNVLEGIEDKFLLRAPSITDEKSDAHNLTIVADSAYAVLGDIVDMVKDYSQTKKVSDRAYTFSYSAINQLVGTVRDNVAAMTTRGLYKTLFQSAISPHMPIDQQQFGDDVAGGLASMMTATDPISFGLAYSELVHIINDYNVKGLEQVNNQLEQSQIANRNARMLAATSHFAYEMNRKLYEPSVSEREYTAYLKSQTEKLSEEMMDIYELDPNEIKIYYQGKKLEPSVPPFVQNGTTMVPLRLITEQIGLDITWNGKEKSISFITEIRWRIVEIVMTIGSKTVQVGNRTTELLEAPVLIDGTTFVPLRFISEQIGLDVTWVPESKSVVIE